MEIYHRPGFPQNSMGTSGGGVAEANYLLRLVDPEGNAVRTSEAAEIGHGPAVPQDGQRISGVGIASTNNLAGIVDVDCDVECACKMAGLGGYEGVGSRSWGWHPHQRQSCEEKR